MGTQKAKLPTRCKGRRILLAVPHPVKDLYGLEKSFGTALDKTDKLLLFK